jgi:predicted outer membrane repeat protein
VQGAKFQDNFGELGGAIAHVVINSCTTPQVQDGVILVVSNSSFTGNVARQGGGGVYAAFSSRLILTGTYFETNLAGRVGGAVLCSACTSVSISNSSFTSNAAGSAGAVAVLQVQQASSITDSKISSSVAFLQEPELLTQWKRDSGMVAAPAANTTSTRTSSSGIGPSGSRPSGLGRMNLTALLVAQPAQVKDAPQLNLNRWPTCGDLGTGGGLCVLPGPGRVLVTGVTLEKNQGVHGGE